MTKEQFEKLSGEQKAAGAASSLLMQLRFAFELGSPDNIYPVLIHTKNFEAREWVRVAVMEGMPVEQIEAYPDISLDEIKALRKKFFLEKEGVQELQDAEETVNRKLQKLQLLVERSEPMEKFLNVILKQKDALIENFKAQTAQMQEQNSRMTEQLKEYGAQIKKLQQTLAENRQANVCEKGESDKENNMEEPETPSGKKAGKFPWPFRRRNADAIAEYLKTPEWTPEQMSFLIDCAEDGMKMNEIKKISAPQLSVERMQLLKKALHSERNR